MSESKSRSFYISFETLFPREQVEVKDAPNVKRMSEVHRMLMDNDTVTETLLQEYCINLWSFVSFVRANRHVRTTVPVDWVVRNQSCNVYWWEVLCRCNHFATLVLAREFKLDAKPHDLAVHFVTIKSALGLLYKVRTELVSAWTDRGTSKTFEQEIDKEIKECNDHHRQLRVRALTIGAQVVERSSEEQLKAAQMYAAVYRLSGFTDEWALRKGLMARSRHCNSIAEYGTAIALGVAFEKLTKDVPHAFLPQWKKDNETVFRQPIPSSLDPKEALLAVGETNAYEQGTLPPKRALFVCKAMS